MPLYVVVNGISKSLGNEFRRRNIPETDPEPGKPLGLVMCILLAASIVPFLGVIAGLVGLVLWILYWLKIAKYSGTLHSFQATESMPPAVTPLGP